MTKISHITSKWLRPTLQRRNSNFIWFAHYDEFIRPWARWTMNGSGIYDGMPWGMKRNKWRFREGSQAKMVDSVISLQRRVHWSTTWANLDTFVVFVFIFVSSCLWNLMVSYNITKLFLCHLMNNFFSFKKLTAHYHFDNHVNNQFC